LGAMAVSTRLLLPGVPGAVLLVAFAVGILALEVFVPYRQYARVLKFLALSLLAYIITGVIIHPDWRQLLLRTIVPNIQFSPAFLALIVAMLGTTISPYLFFWQASEEVEETELHGRVHTGTDRQRQRLAVLKQLRSLRVDTVLGMVASEVTTWFIIVTTSSTLNAHGITNIATADQAARALRPLAGPFAEAVFALGIVGTGLLAIPVLAGSAAYGIAESFGWREGLAKTINHARGFYCVIGAATLVGLAINFLGVDPIAALVYTAVINGIVAVPLLVLILLIANNRSIMGDHTNGRLSNSVGIAATALMGVAAVVTIASLFWH
ncbi:MAG: NRAMP family divalent metal transporter, partial [Ktedonobacterales bacterium]